MKKRTLQAVVVSLFLGFLVTDAVAAARQRHFAFLLPQHNPHEGGQALSKSDIARAMEAPDGVFRPRAVSALIAYWKVRGLPVSTSREAADFLASARVREVLCRDVAGAGKRISTAWIEDSGAVKPFERPCSDGEMVYEWEQTPGVWRAFMLSGCGNPVDDKRPVSPPPATPPVQTNAECPVDTRSYTIHLLGEEGVRQDLLVAAKAYTAGERDFTGAAMSRSVGDDLLACIKSGQCTHAPGDYRVRRSWIREGVDRSIVEEPPQYVQELMAYGGVLKEDVPSTLMYSDFIYRVVFEERQSDGRIVTGPKKSRRTNLFETRSYPNERVKENRSGQKVCRYHTWGLLSGVPTQR